MSAILDQGGRNTLRVSVLPTDVRRESVMYSQFGPRSFSNSTEIKGRLCSSIVRSYGVVKCVLCLFMGVLRWKSLLPTLIPINTNHNQFFIQFYLFKFLSLIVCFFSCVCFCIPDGRPNFSVHIINKSV